MFGLLSINSLASIALDRYMVIAKSPSHANFQTSTYLILASWTYALIWALPPLFGWNRYTWEGYGTTCSFDYITKSTKFTSFIWSMFVGGFVVPLLVISACYISIFLSVMKYSNKFHGHTCSTNCNIHMGSRQYKHSIKVKTAKVTLWCILLYCVSWTPYAVVALMGITTDGEHITPLLATLPGLFAKASTIYNPILYALSHPQMKTKIKAMLRRKRKTTKRQQKCNAAFL